MPFIFPPKFKSCFVEVVSSWVSLWIINRHKEMRKPSVRSMYEAEWLLSCFGATRESSIIQGSLKDQNGQGLVSGIQITSAMLVPPRELVQILQRKKEFGFYRVKAGMNRHCIHWPLVNPCFRPMSDFCLMWCVSTSSGKFFWVCWANRLSLHVFLALDPQCVVLRLAASVSPGNLVTNADVEPHLRHTEELGVIHTHVQVWEVLF